MAYSRKQLPYDEAAYDALALEMKGWPPLPYGSAASAERAAYAIERAWMAGPASGTIIAARLNKRGAPGVRGSSPWDSGDIGIAKENASQFRAQAYVKANPPPPPSQAVREQHRAQMAALAAEEATRTNR